MSSKIVDFSPLPLLFALLACSDTGPAVDEGQTTTDPGGTVGGTSSDTDSGSTSETETGATTETETGGPECGDGVVEADELCDDGNAVDDDGCSNTCTPRMCSITWSQVDDGPSVVDGSSSDDYRVAITELPNGDIAVAGVDDSSGDADLRVRVYTPAGEPIADHLVALSPARDQVFGLLADANGDLLLAGAGMVDVDGVATVLRLSGVDASELWRFEIDGELSSTYDWASGLALDDQGRVIVSTMVTRGNGGRWVELRTLDGQTGAPIWMGEWLGGSDDYDFVTDLLFDPSRARIYAVVADHRGTEWWEPVLLGFDPPEQAPVLEASPLGDAVDSAPEFDVPLGLTITADGRMWMANQEFTDGVMHAQLSELDPVDGALLGSYDVREFGVPELLNNTDARALRAQPQGGSIWAGLAVVGNSIDHSFMVVLDEDAQIDCLALTGAGRLAQVLAASDGGLYAAGIIPFNDGAHAALVRVR
jgi:cysteine-rich repeat protein